MSDNELKKAKKRVRLTVLIMIFSFFSGLAIGTLGMDYYYSKKVDRISILATTTSIIDTVRTLQYIREGNIKSAIDYSQWVLDNSMVDLYNALITRSKYSKHNMMLNRRIRFSLKKAFEYYSHNPTNITKDEDIGEAFKYLRNLSK